MRSYMRLGEVPRKRHMRFQENGRLAFEELFGREGFNGPSSLIYHRHMPEGAQDVTTFSPEESPPRLRGTTWSSVSRPFDVPQ